MPLILSSYRAPWWLSNAHAHTIYPASARRVEGVVYQRERLELSDGDFLDLDWSRVGASRVVVVTHGLEGSSNRSYVLGMVRAFNRRGWDAVAMNFRGCSGESNRLLRFYHSGVSEDLWEVLAHVRAVGYQTIAAIGFSLGGNVALKLMGDLGAQAPDWLLGAVGISVPCDLRASSVVMARPVNRIYMRRFLADLREKIRAKQPLFPGQLDVSGYDRIRSFKQFDDRYTAPLHGFKDAEDYWARSSAVASMGSIARPSLLLNAADDPFLGEECFPTRLAEPHEFLHLEIPKEGGHVGFVGGGLLEDEYYSERRALEFLESLRANQGT